MKSLTKLQNVCHLCFRHPFLITEFRNNVLALDKFYNEVVFAYTIVSKIQFGIEFRIDGTNSDLHVLSNQSTVRAFLVPKRGT